MIKNLGGHLVASQGQALRSELNPLLVRIPALITSTSIAEVDSFQVKALNIHFLLRHGYGNTAIPGPLFLTRLSHHVKWAE